MLNLILMHINYNRNLELNKYNVFIPYLTVLNEIDKNPDAILKS